MATDDTSWRTQSFRQGVIAKIEEAIQKAGMPTAKNSADMETHVFLKAKSKEEYLGFVARLILHVREMNSKKQGGGKTRGRCGGGGPDMSDPIGALQTLARQGTGNNLLMGIPNSGPNPQGMVPQPNTNSATNLLQSLNQRPRNGVTMVGMQNKMQGIGMMSGQTVGVGHMGQMQGMQNNALLTQMNQINQGNMNPQMVQMGPAQMGQVGTQMGGGQPQQNMQNQIQTQVPGQMGGSMVSGMQGGIQSGMQQMSQMGSGEMSSNPLQQQILHVQRKPTEMLNAGFPGPRNVTPNTFLRQSPSPSVTSPGGLVPPSSNQMVPSPALVASPMSQPSIHSGQQRSLGIALSPSSSLNTPAGITVNPSPIEDHAYKEKIRKLTKYVEPLRKMIARSSGEGNADKTAKMKKLLEILSTPTKRMPLETLQKCELVLERMDFKRGDGSVGPALATLKEHLFVSPLLEAVSLHLQSPLKNHTLQRTFGPCLEAFFGPEIKNLPPPLKRKKVKDSTSEIPDVLQGEIARLDQRFKVSLDPAQQSGSLCIQLICWLDDRHLPCVPPVSVTVPADYPLTPPRCVMSPHEYTTAFLSGVKEALSARISKLPQTFSVSQLLHTWEMSVRQASAPSTKPLTSSAVLMGV